VTVPLLQIDAFTDQPFGGNPAAICLLEAPADERWMQAVAAEMNLSETAFVVPEGGRHGLRWFTPTVEVELCGHATLAAAHALWSEGVAPAGEPIRFSTRSGELTARGEGSRITIDLPLDPPEELAPPPDLVPLLGVLANRVGRGASGNWLVEVATEAEVRSARPDLVGLAAAGHAVVLTAPGAESGIDVVSRYFAPSYGIDEDPVTGSAHCLLAPWWAPRAGTALAAHQVSARGGSLQVRLEGDRVHLGGRAVTVFTGSLLAPPP
jgi:PhzF family phenazine biosynthesis protein